MHKVDIICLVHNQLPITRGFVKSIFTHTENFRLIFVDNGSTDDTPEFLEQGKKKGKWEVISPGENLGVIGGRNLGVQHVESDFFMNIDNDQWPQRGWLEGLFSLIDKGYDIVGPEAWLLTRPKSGGSTTIGDTVIPDRSYFPQKHCEHPKDKFSYIGCGGTLMKKKVYDEIGLFDERFNPAYFEDPDFSWRAMQADFKLGWFPKCPIEHLAHQTFNFQNLFKKNDQFIRSWKAFQEKWSPYFPDPLQM